ncbi:MAG TPA: sodium:calcium antiporter [Candidatus Moranbacteria bacterium]|nr:sodium:calcium antiporter [Candidatus Moranbacteria bacterium]
MLANGLIYLSAFIGTWIGSGLAINSAEKISKLSGVSQFTISFLLIGVLSSTSELSVGINSLIKDDPEIFIGNLVGASIVLFLLIIPLLAIGGKKLNIDKEFRGFHLPTILLVIALPSFFVLDGEVGKIDSLIVLSFFLILFAILHNRKKVARRRKSLHKWLNTKVFKEFLRLFFGIAIIFTAGNFIVEETSYFSNELGVPKFILSLLLISIGTNFPELIIALRSIVMRKAKVVFAGYIGSATMNTLLFGVFSLLYGKNIILTNSYTISLAFVIIGLILFYIFARTKNSLSRKEGLALLSLYLIFLVSHFIF